MHIPPGQAIDDEAQLYGFIRDNPLGVLTTALASSHELPLLQSTHIPWVLDPHDGTVLRGHMARANPHTKILIEAADKDQAEGRIGDEVMVLFTAPHNAYVTPKFYIKTKPETGKVVPTWNYSAVQVHGRAKVFTRAQEEETKQFLSKQLCDLTDELEQRHLRLTGKGDEAPWKVADAPQAYVNVLSRGIIGIEIAVTRIEGRHKMSQDKHEEDREGVSRGFENVGTETGQIIADLVRELGSNNPDLQ
ncbi:transcriptional regulator [Acaromyces ingoldii]|uniref:Transcriptional regulator n=1 Tax=Acaromyces ingoldii TaxID=215250 RepID=A0A316YTX3_9BASI|nr:transcriptional regulator [Acaromyces ingoldii]PWN92582.1 transcriptional regulator [Acaromyces ingoldii]